VLLHGFMDTWRTWQLVLPALERHHDVLAPTHVGHAGGPRLAGEVSETLLVEAIERAMDDAGFETAHVVGNSLGGYVALQLAERGRARSVVALAPAGGWDVLPRELFSLQRDLYAQAQHAAAHVDAIVATPEGRRAATQLVVENYEHIPPELIAYQVLGLARCDAAPALLDFVERAEWHLDADRIMCPMRFVWGTADRLLPWSAAAVRYRALFPGAEWVELDGVGHYPQLDVPAEAAELITGLTGH
jgi:pimeloyl-ACP methyl ester carboxylesterase